jgi:hypothetical protein
MPKLAQATAFARRLAAVARSEHAAYGGVDEDDEPLRGRIQYYYRELGFPFQSVEVAWSAVFVSFCVREAGATEREFRFAMRHSEFVYEAINRPGAFEGHPIEARAVNVGDIVHHNRRGTRFDFEHARRNAGYLSHSAIVVERGEDERGKFALTIGGNEGDSVRRKRVRLNADGTIAQRDRDPFIALLKCRKRS